MNLSQVGQWECFSALQCSLGICAAAWSNLVFRHLKRNAFYHFPRKHYAVSERLRIGTRAYNLTHILLFICSPTDRIRSGRCVRHTGFIPTVTSACQQRAKPLLKGKALLTNKLSWVQNSNEGNLWACRYNLVSQKRSYSRHSKPPLEMSDLGQAQLCIPKPLNPSKTCLRGHLFGKGILLFYWHYKPCGPHQGEQEVGSPMSLPRLFPTASVLTLTKQQWSYILSFLYQLKRSKKLFTSLPFRCEQPFADAVLSWCSWKHSDKLQHFWPWQLYLKKLIAQMPGTNRFELSYTTTISVCKGL